VDVLFVDVLPVDAVEVTGNTLVVVTSGVLGAAVSELELFSVGVSGTGSDVNSLSTAEVLGILSMAKSAMAIAPRKMF
jgi:hypothetical protein